MKSQAIDKIDKERAAYKGDKYGQAMKEYVAGALKDFCEQNEEFAQAVVQGGSFEDCMKAVCKSVGSSISDIEVSKRAAGFYFPGCVVECQMKIYMSKYEAEEPEQESVGVILRLEDFL